MSIILSSGQWGLFCDEGGRKLVRADSTACGPISARKALSVLPRRLLLDEGRLGRAMSGESSGCDIVGVDGRRWQVITQGLLSPKTHQVVGVIAGVFPFGESLPPTQRVGVWEWHIDCDENGIPSPVRRIYWDKNLFVLYGIDPGVARRHTDYWETGEWVDNLIDEGDQMRVSSTARDGIAARASGARWGLLCLTYTVVTGYGTDVRGQRRLRLVGGVAREGGRVIARGFSYEVPDTFTDIALWSDAEGGRVDEALRGGMALVLTPMAVADASSGEILITSPSWRQHRLERSGGLNGILEVPGGRLDDTVDRALAVTDPVYEDRVRVKTLAGTWLDAGLALIGVHNSLGSHDVVIRLDLQQSPHPE